MCPQRDSSSYVERLEREREELLANIRAHPVPEVEQMTYGSQAEAGSEVFEQQRELSLLQHLQTQLRQVEEAILRVRQGTHGLCEACGQPIPPERLEVLPEAKLCVECQRKRERRR
jgi:RNA polymerase-binding transcription factor